MSDVARTQVFPKTKWKHKNGLEYEVILIANEASTDQVKYPITVVYQGANAKVWSKPLNDWHRSMTLI